MMGNENKTEKQTETQNKEEKKYETILQDWNHVNITETAEKVKKEFIDEKNQVEAIIDAIKAKENVLLIGATGTAKTFLIKQISEKTGIPSRVINMQVNTTNDEIKGKYAPTEDGKIKWINGEVTQAMKNGEILIIEEINFMPPEISSTLFSITDHRRNLKLEEHQGEEITPHHNFRIIATMNPGYSGTNQLNSALENRFTFQAILDYLTKTQEKRLMKNRYKLKEEKAEILCEITKQIRQMKDEFENDLSTRIVEATARAIKRGLKIEEAISYTIMPIIAKDKFAQEKLKEIIKTVKDEYKAKEEKRKEQRKLKRKPGEKETKEKQVEIKRIDILTGLIK